MTARLNSTASYWSWRQIARRAMAAALPRRLFMVSGPTSRPVAFLTFDDGPHPDYTPQILDTLSARQVRATFFVVGEQAKKQADLVRRMAREGHSIGHHTYYHRPLAETTSAQLLEETRQASDLLLDLVGKRPSLFRPPYGKLRAVALFRLWAAGQTVVLWSLDPKDYAIGSPGDLVQWFSEHPIRRGDIALLHDSHAATPVALREIIDRTRRQGLEFATLDDPLVCRRLRPDAHAHR